MIFTTENIANNKNTHPSKTSGQIGLNVKCWNINSYKMIVIYLGAQNVSKTSVCEINFFHVILS